MKKTPRFWPWLEHSGSLSSWIEQSKVITRLILIFKIDIMQYKRETLTASCFRTDRPKLWTVKYAIKHVYCYFLPHQLKDLTGLHDTICNARRDETRSFHFFSFHKTDLEKVSLGLCDSNWVILQTKSVRTRVRNLLNLPLSFVLL